MKSCQFCNCEIPSGSRFCPICGQTLNADAHAAYSPLPEPPKPASFPAHDSDDLSAFETRYTYGATFCTVLRVISVIISVLVFAAAVVFGTICIIDAKILAGCAVIGCGLVGAFVIFFLLNIGVIFFENLSLTGRNTETQYRISLAQLEILGRISAAQEESLQLNRCALNLLKTIDGECFDSGKQQERQTELIEKLMLLQIESSEDVHKTCERVATLKESSDAIAKAYAINSQKVSSWRRGMDVAVKSCAAGILSLSERMKRRIPRTAEPEAAREPSDVRTAALSSGGETSLYRDGESPEESRENMLVGDAGRQAKN